MPRNISFMLTTPQFKAQTKDVTRRLGWAFLKPGDVLMGCEKCQGLGKGGKITRLGLIRVVSVRFEELRRITAEDVVREGFPEMTRQEFIEFFCKHNKCLQTQIVTRIEFEYLDDLDDIHWVSRPRELEGEICEGFDYCTDCAQKFADEFRSKFPEYEEFIHARNDGLSASDCPATCSECGKCLACYIPESGVEIYNNDAD